MTTLQDLDRIIPNLIGQLEQLKSEISRYKKLDIDVRARSLINSINKKIQSTKAGYEYFKITPEYYSENFDNFVNDIKQFIKNSKKYYEQDIKVRENVAEITF